MCGHVGHEGADVTDCPGSCGVVIQAHAGFASAVDNGAYNQGGDESAGKCVDGGGHDIVEEFLSLHVVPSLKDTVVRRAHVIRV